MKQGSSNACLTAALTTGAALFYKNQVPGDNVMYRLDTDIEKKDCSVFRGCNR